MAYKKAVVQDYEEYDKYKTYKKPSEYELVSGINGNGKKKEEPGEVNPGIAKAIERECGQEIALAILKMTCSNFTDHTAVLSTTTIFNITSLLKEKYDYIINLHKINDIKKLDIFLDAVNSKLEDERFFLLLRGDKRPEEAQAPEKVSSGVKLYLLFF